MIIQLRRWLPHYPLVVVVDPPEADYAVLELLHFCQTMAHPVTFITRLRLDGALYEPAPPRRPGQMGRPRLKGKRLPALKQLLDQPTTAWETLLVNWYDGTQRYLEVVSATAVWYHMGKAPVAIRWVLIRDPRVNLSPRHFCAPSFPSNQPRSSNGSCCAGPPQAEKSPSRRCGHTWE